MGLKASSTVSVSIAVHPLYNKRLKLRGSSHCVSLVALLSLSNYELIAME